MEHQLAGKVALITGATSGIGEATAIQFAEEGASVAIVGRSETRGRAIAARLGKPAIFISADVTREADIEFAVTETVKVFGRLDVLFNNAGSGVPGRLEDVTPEQFRHAMDLLLGSVIFGTKHAAPIMRRQGSGAIINNSSIAGLRTNYGDYLYSMAKAAVTHATRLAGMELGRYGITVNSIAPGAIPTAIFFGGMDSVESPATAERKLSEVQNRMATATPLCRAGRPQDVALAAVFLASEGGSFVNCEELVVDGGMSAGGRIRFSVAP